MKYLLILIFITSFSFPLSNLGIIKEDKKALVLFSRWINGTPSYYDLGAYYCSKHISIGIFTDYQYEQGQHISIWHERFIKKIKQLDVFYGLYTWYDYKPYNNPELYVRAYGVIFGTYGKASDIFEQEFSLRISSTYDANDKNYLGGRFVYACHFTINERFVISPLIYNYFNLNNQIRLLDLIFPRFGIDLSYMFIH